MNTHSHVLVVAALLCLAGVTYAKLPDPQKGCDLSDGRWVRAANRFPRYTGLSGEWNSCPYIRSEYSCQRNNRPDDYYTQYRWQPDKCIISYFSAPGFKYMMRKKNMLVVGDSIMMNFYESLLCLINTGGYKGEELTLSTNATFDIRRVRFSAFSGSIDFYFAPYLVRATKLSKKSSADSRGKAGGGHAHDVYVDEIDPTLAKILPDYDAVVLGTGIWWLQNKPGFREPNQFYANGEHRNLTNSAAHTWGITTVAKYIKSSNYSGVPYFLSYSPKHGGRGAPQPGVKNKKKGPNFPEWVGACGARGPIDEEEKIKYANTLPSAKAYADAQQVTLAGTPVRFLPVTQMSEVRPDGHLGVWWQPRNQTGPDSPGGRKESPFTGDCTHWCLPGVPDAWVDVLFTNMKFEGSFQ
ncbi:unnamed protein product [Closterium sp. NIES-64]|nr:unnamed protein product [Closterium sp. NIES-64]CAI5967181.1 unnamed protein product [Closterium sp. NIES-65]